MRLEYYLNDMLMIFRIMQSRETDYRVSFIASYSLEIT